jgi:ABC-type nitrate/sulfonate/bicarbonate transport system substrate-binding protein
VNKYTIKKGRLVVQEIFRKNFHIRRAGGKSQIRHTVVISVIAVVLAACSSSSHSSESAVPTLRVAALTGYVGNGPLWVALAEGLFARNGVNVEMVQGAVATGSSLLASGQIDLLASPPANAINVAKQGRPTTSLFNLSNFGGGVGSLVARTGIASVDQLKALNTNCVLADVGPGTGLRAYNNVVERTYGIHCTLRSIAGYPALVSQISAGQVDAAAVLPIDAYTLAAQKKVNILIDPEKLTNAQSSALVPTPYTNNVIIGLQSFVKDPQHRQALISFLRALKQANEVLLATPPTELAHTLIAKLPSTFGTTPPESLVRNLEVFHPLFPSGPQAGSISQQSWRAMLESFQSDWEVPISIDDPVAQYASRVDMSLFMSTGK